MGMSLYRHTSPPHPLALLYLLLMALYQVLCETDRECPYKYYCHSGEGHKSCLKCRKSHRRCHSNKMCCQGNTCVEGRCIPHQFRFDEAYNTAVQNFESEVEEEESFIQDTKYKLRKAREGEQCSSSLQCEDGLCCAQHLWSKICKPMLEEGDICTKKRDRLTDVFQRCECSEGLSCKRDSVAQRRLHVCQAVKHRSSGTSTERDGAEGALREETSAQRERLISLPVEKIRPLPSKNDGDLLGYLSAESGEKLFDLASRGERWIMPLGRPPAKLKGTAYRDTTEITRTEQTDIEASQLTVL
ncbi:dickkopf-related protein 2-like [Lytechinus variegatus]|uniref:dickkopf-related protein 2-like n=1 Tax=Lytechinus variegatus TaxID=7654 RepID=UPI001BB122FD|nr:dickkopf-related protein 2-like [Lytechinus variegatus]